MSTHNYLDDLDNLLDNPRSETSASVGKRQTTQSITEVVQDTDTLTTADSVADFDQVNEAQVASHTWAAVIESASRALQDSTQMAQEAARKNIELAKEQQESIKELSDAASGWRHATRQAVQEVNATKKNIIILTVISGLIAIAGFGTTIGVMLQSRAALANMSNTILENVDEHQSMVSKTLTLKIDELASTIEQMQGSLDQLNNPKSSKTSTIPSNNNEAPAMPEVASEPEVITTPSPVSETHNVSDPQPSSGSNAQPQAMTPTPAPAPGPILISESPQTPNLTTTQSTTGITEASWQKLTAQVDLLQQQLTSLESNTHKFHDEQTKQAINLASQLDEKLGTRLSKVTNQLQETKPATVVTSTSTQDNKAVLDQLSRLRQEIQELRILQQGLKDQVSQVKQTVSESNNKPYQYRLPQDGERYPR